MIIREHYLKEIRDFYDSDLIKIITGIRRCGKSVILNQIRNEVKKKTDNIIYLNFEERATSSTINTVDQLLSYIEKNRKKGKCYIFLDEIQTLDDWHEAVKTLRLHDNSVFITGSNSKLLSKEFTTFLSGRFVSFHIKPFIYKEILEYSKKLGKDTSILEYLIWGGFPKRIEFNNDESIKKYLNELNDTIVLNDLLNRYNIKKINLFKSIVDFILTSNSRVVSTRSIKKYISQNNINCSVNTLIKYLDYLEEAYIIEKIKPYSLKTKTTLKYYFKVYNEDVSFNSIRCFTNRYDLSHNLENIIYNELQYRKYDVKVLNNEKSEIDFIALKGNKKYYVQVALSVAEEKAYNREMTAFTDLDKDAERILITNDEIDYSTSLVRHIKLKDFLLSDSL